MGVQQEQVTILPGSLLGMASLLCRSLWAPPGVRTKPADPELGQREQPGERRPKHSTAGHTMSSVSFYPNAKSCGHRGEGRLSKKATPLPRALKV